jgi:hypothetical protein
MSGTDMNWPLFAAVVGIVAAIALLPVLLARKWTALGFIIALANIIVVVMNAAAPLRGILTPNDSSYRFGILQSDGGIVAGSFGGIVVLGAFLAAFLILRNGRGPVMLLLTLIDGFFAFNIGVPLAQQLLSNPSEAIIKFGQYLTIPPPIAIPLLVFVFVVPFACGAIIGLLRAGRAKTE